MEKVVYACTMALMALRRKFTFLTLSRKFTSSHQTKYYLLSTSAYCSARKSSVVYSDYCLSFFCNSR